MSENGNSQRGIHVEVIVCTFNGEKYIAEQLDSILAQSRKPDLISIYDDVSRDNTIAVVAKIVEKFGGADIEIRVVRNLSNLGYVGNFSQGIKESKGDILFFSDQDDRWHADKIKIALNLLNETGSDLVFTDGNLIDSVGRMIPGNSVLGHYGLSGDNIENFSNQAITRLVRKNYINGAAMAVRRDAAMAALPVPSGLPHDYWLAIWCALHGGIAASVQRLYDYRQHPNNVIGVGLSKWYYVWYGILRSPSTPRMIEHARYSSFIPRIESCEMAGVFIEKLQWLEACVAQKGRLSRLWSILASSLSGQYRRFGGGYSWVRDVVSIFKVSK